MACTHVTDADFHANACPLVNVFHAEMISLSFKRLVFTITTYVAESKTAVFLI